MAHISIETSQNVSLDLSVAGIGERILAYLIDLLVIGLYYFALYHLLDQTSILDGWGDDNRVTYRAIFNILFLGAPIYMYDLIFEIFNNGKSPGKMAMKLQVLKTNGEPAGVSEYWLRWLMRPIDFYGQFILVFILYSIFPDTVVQVLQGSSFAFIGVVAVITISTSKSGQRIGDLLAGTTVTKTRNTVSLADTILLKTKKNYQPTYPNALKLSDKDVRLIKETLQYYSKTKDIKYVKKLAEKAKDYLELDKTGKPLKFLTTLMKDYNHLAMQEEGL